jgi:hypothetical protein
MEQKANCAFEIDFKENVTASPPKGLVEKLEQRKDQVDMESINNKLIQAEQKRNQQMDKRKALGQLYNAKVENV